MEIYVAILEDKHTDDQIELFQNRRNALDQIAEWKSDYDEIWEEEEIKGWEYYVRSECEDGPSMRIEKKELKSISCE